jgi:glycosyltransferase involved in cell wall biosynthesis
MDHPEKFRFLFVSAMFSGNATYFENLRQAISPRNDVTATWLPIELEPREFFARIPPLSLNNTLKNGMVTRSRLRSLEKSGITFDAAFINHVTPARFLSGFMKRVPTIISLDATPTLLDSFSKWYEMPAPSSPDSLVERVKHRLTRNVYMNATSLIVWSSQVKRSLVTDYGINEEKVVVLPPGINLQLWGQPSSKGKRDRARSRQVNVLFVGAHFLRKGGDLLLRVSRRDEFKSCQFHFVTTTFEGTRETNTFVHSNVHANTETLRSLYRNADIFVFPSRADFSPLAVCEAMASGLPVLSTDVGGLGELTENGRSGFIVPVDDEEGLANQLRLLVEEPDTRIQMGRAARKRAEELFDLEKNASTIVDMLKRVSRAESSRVRVSTREHSGTERIR